MTVLHYSVLKFMQNYVTTSQLPLLAPKEDMTRPYLALIAGSKHLKVSQIQWQKHMHTF